MDETSPIENKMVSRSIADAQKRVEGYHFDVRKQLVDFDDVVNKQREIVYAERRKILKGADLKTNILDMVKGELKDILTEYTADSYEPDYEGMISVAKTIMPFPPEIDARHFGQMEPKEVEEELFGLAEGLYSKREQEFGEDKMRLLERILLLKTIDSLWVEHLTNMEDMRLQAGWQTLRQTKATDAYKNEGFKAFQVLLDTIRQEVSRGIFRMAIVKQGERPVKPPAGLRATGPGMLPLQPGSSRRPGVPVVAAGKKVGRNEPCTCGSGKKFKHCCGR